MAFPLCHVAGLRRAASPTCAAGAIVLTPMFEPELWMQLVDEHGITGTGDGPDDAATCCSSTRRSTTTTCDSLRSIGYGAAAMPVEVLRPAIERFGPIVYSGFGMTELGGNVLTFPKAAHVRAVNGEEHLLASCGTPMCLADVKVVDERHGRVPAGRRRRDRHPRRAGAEGLLPQRGGHDRRRSTAAGSTPATWPAATRRASSTSSTA